MVRPGFASDLPVRSAIALRHGAHDGYGYRGSHPRNPRHRPGREYTAPARRPRQPRLRRGHARAASVRQPAHAADARLRACLPIGAHRGLRPDHLPVPGPIPPHPLVAAPRSGGRQPVRDAGRPPAECCRSPNVLAPGRLLGNGPDTTTWLWTFWHLGPPLFALPYAILEGERRPPQALRGQAGRIGLFTIAGTVAAAALTGVVAARYVHLLPKCVDGDNYWLLTASGIGPGVVALTVVALAVLGGRPARTVLQLWLAVSLLLLVFDNMVTLPGAARGTVGWFAGRMEALVAGFILLGVYLREVDFLYAQAEATADEREARRAELQRARDNLALALEAAEMGDWDLDLGTGTSRRSPRHDAIFGHHEPVDAWDVESFLGRVVPDERDAVRAAFEAAGDKRTP